MNTKTSNNSLFYRAGAIFMIAMLLLAAMPVKSVFAAVGVSGQWAAGAVIDTATATSPRTGTYVVPAGANRLLVVSVITEHSAVTAHAISATYGGQALTLITENTAQRETVWIGYLKEAGIVAAANTTLSVNFATANFTRITVHAATYNGVDQTTPIAGSNSTSSAGATSLTYGANIPVVNGGYIFYTTVHNNNTATAPGGYTEHFDAAFTTYQKTAASQVVAANGTQNQTVNFAGNDRTALAVVSLNPVPVAPVAPAITSANATTFNAGLANTFTVTATGNPAPTFSVAGTLPAGVTLSAAGVLSGTPGVGTTGVYPITITASNGVLPNATQNFTLTVQAAPEMNVQGNGITIADGDATSSPADGTDFGNVGVGVSVFNTFTIQNTGVGNLTLGAITFTGPQAASFTVTTPPTSPVIPGGSTTFVVRVIGGGDATINIANNDSDENPYNFAVSSFGIATNSEMGIQFSGITITDGDASPSTIDGTNFGNVVVGLNNTLTYTIRNLGAANLTLGAITIGGAQAAEFSVFSAPTTPVIPGGSTTVQLRFIPSAVGARNATFSIVNNDPSENPYNFSITGTGIAGTAPVITSAAPANGTLGAAYTHTYTATGTAPITYSVTAGALPNGLTLTSSGVLSGTPTAIGLYTGTVTATNGVLPNATQNFSITINEAPAITSPNNASFSLGVAGTFTVTATGSPAPTLSMTGTLPAGVTFTPATGALAGTPAAGTGGIYPLTFTAANGVLPDATQSFTLTVTDGPSITSANTTSFSLGLPGTFTVTAVGSPAPTLSMVGTLPSGVTFTPATGILAGTPAAGTVGSYPLTFTATNGILPDATQAFTLTVKNGPIVAPNGINSVPDTGNGSISNNESIANTLGITQLIVRFDQDVYDPAGNTDPKDVTNPANYMLVLGSSAGVFQTVSCLGGLVAPDVAISVDSVAYSNGGGSGPFVATVNINGGLPLNANGFYRLYVCGTTSIVDAADINLELAGDGTNPGTDFLINFRIQARATGGGGGGNNNTTSTTSAKATLIPVTGFAPHKVTVLPAQPADKAYKSLGEIRIEIPSLGINYPIVGAMIDRNTWDLTWLKDVAYLEGSAYPTLAGNTVLTAHVRDANNNLGPFSDIKGMQIGQKIYIHANGQTYVYQVQENTKILPSNISAAFKHEENSWITLVTCEDYNAKTELYSHRRMVRAVLISIISEK